MRVPPPEKLREMWEQAQARRKKKQLAERRKGKCYSCHNRPVRAPGESTCKECHARRETIGTRRRRLAKRKEEELAAKEARKKERADRALKRKLAKEGENRAYLDFLVT